MMSMPSHRKHSHLFAAIGSALNYEREGFRFPFRTGKETLLPTSRLEFEVDQTGASLCHKGRLSGRLRNARISTAVAKKDSFHL